MRLAGLSIYPVKSCQGTSHDRRAVEPRGLDGDRLWVLVDADARVISQREEPRLAAIAAEIVEGGVRLSIPDAQTLTVGCPLGGEPVEVAIWSERVPARIADPAACEALSTYLGRSCRLVFMDDPAARRTDPSRAPAGSTVSFADAFPLLLTSEASLADLNARLARPVGMERFRPNLVIDGDTPWAEDGWRRVRIGSVVFAVSKPCGRCVVVTIDQRTGRKPRPGQPLKTLAAFRRTAEGVIFGQNLVAMGEGVLDVGDPVEILD